MIIFRVSDTIRVRVRFRNRDNFEVMLRHLLSVGPYEVQECECAFGFEL